MLAVAKELAYSATVLISTVKCFVVQANAIMISLAHKY
jgi:hypothetical protein